MKRLFQLILITFGTAMAGLTAYAQTNPYGIDDECYKYFSEAELKAGKEGFQEVNDALLRTAISKGDTKAQTLYYVERLKHACRIIPSGVTTTAEYDAEIVKKQEDLKEVAANFGFPQYFYYSYELVQNYFFNHNKPVRTMELLQEMQQTATERKEPYGQWLSYRYMVALYIAQCDYITAKRYILQSLKLYYETTDPVVRKQSVSRLYCDLSDTYIIGADSVKVNINKAVAHAQHHLDSLRCEYHLAKLSAYEKRHDDYIRHRDFCLKDPALFTISNNAERVLKTLDSIIEGHFDFNSVYALSSARVREIKYIANVAEVYGYKDQAFDIERLLVRKFEEQLAALNQSKIVELDARLGNQILTSELAGKTKELLKTSRRVSALLGTILAAVLLFTLYEIQALRRRRRKDEQQIRDLKEANEKVMAADAAKTRFVQNMSHEVRTPLNAIVGFSQLLALPDGTFPEEEKEEFSGHIVNNTKMLTMLLDDILNASAMDSGKYRISFEEGEVNFMCQAAISSAEHRLQPGVTMNYEPESSEPFNFITDPRRVQQILINLLTNSCKHTAKGSITLTSSLTAEPGWVTFAVTDTGTGVPADKAEAIFDRFTKLNDFVQGTGLGLSICRDIADRMGAKVFLDTAWPGPGARFVFAVPVNPPQEIINQV